MTTTTSCNKKRFLAFFGSLVRKNLALSVLLFCIGFIVMPLPFAMTALAPDNGNPLLPSNPVCGLGGLYTYVSVFFVPILWVAAAAVMGLAQTAYMQNRRAVDVYHSLPLTRKQLLTANYLAAYLSVAVPMILNYAFTLLLSAVRCHRFESAVFAPGAAVFGLVLWLVSLAGMLSVAFLVSTQTGSVFDTLLFTGILLAAPLFLALVHQMLCHVFLFGYQAVFDLVQVARFSPLTLGLLDPIGSLLGMEELCIVPGWVCLIWAVLSGLLFAAACFLYERRPSERAEAPSRTGLLALFIRILTMLILCPVGGYVFAFSVAETPSRALVLVGTVLCGIFGFLILEAILNRGTRGLFKAFPLGLGLTALVTAYMAALCTGGLGYETRQPSAEEIASVTINYRGQFDHVPFFSYDANDFQTSVYNTTLQTSDAIKAVLQLQADAVAEYQASGQLLANSFTYSDSDVASQSLYITYDLKNGKSIQRSYGVWLTPVILQDYTALANCAELDQNCSPLINTTAKDYDCIRATGTGSLVTQTIYDSNAIDALLEALRKDTARLGVTGMLDEHAKVPVVLCLETRQPAAGQPYADSFYGNYTVQLTESYVDTLAALQLLGYEELWQNAQPALSRVWLSSNSTSYIYFADKELGHILVDWMSQPAIQTYTTHYDNSDDSDYSYFFPLKLSADECDLQTLLSLGKLRMAKEYESAIWMIFESEDGTLSLPLCTTESALRAAGYGDLVDTLQTL